jgi:hypothetical protein
MSASDALTMAAMPRGWATFTVRFRPSRDLTESVSPSTLVILPHTRTDGTYCADSADAAIIAANPARPNAALPAGFAFSGAQHRREAARRPMPALVGSSVSGGYCLTTNFAAGVRLGMQVHIPLASRKLLGLFRCQRGLPRYRALRWATLLRKPQCYRPLTTPRGGSVEMGHRRRSR